MSEYRKKIEGFVWPIGLRKWVRFLSRDADGSWFAWEFRPQIFYGTDWDRDSGNRIECYVLDLPIGNEPLLLCRDDYETVSVPTGTEARVCEDIARRQQLGVTKYRTTVAENPLTHLQWLRHAYEEAIDFAIYLRRAIETHEAVQLDQSKTSSP